jgi:hypothetical protein
MELRSNPAELDRLLKQAIFALCYQHGPLRVTEIGTRLHRLNLVNPATFSYIKGRYGGLKVWFCVFIYLAFLSFFDIFHLTNSFILLSFLFY